MGNQSISNAGTRALVQQLQAGQDKLVDAAFRIHEMPSSGQKQKYSDDEVRQMCQGFTALLLEALRGESTDVWSMVMETMIPGLVAAGETVESVVAWNASFMVLLACELVRVLPADAQIQATDWLTAFTGRYAASVAGAARAAMAARK